ncbi:MAG: hypothetical protein RLP44_06285 [Aggregatilineales bacterium]
MFGLFKRNTKELMAETSGRSEYRAETAPENNYLEIYQEKKLRENRRELRESVQLFLHTHNLFPSAIDADKDWSEVTFYPSNPQFKRAARELRHLQNQGVITVEEPLDWHGYNGWTAKVRLSD